MTLRFRKTKECRIKDKSNREREGKEGRSINYAHYFESIKIRFSSEIVENIATALSYRSPKPEVRIFIFPPNSLKR